MIEYSLARVCVLQLYKRSVHEGFEMAWKDYCLLCEKGGSISFLEAIEMLDLDSPFEEATIEKIARFLEEQLAAMYA